MTIGGNDVRTENGLTWPKAIRECLEHDIREDCHIADPKNYTLSKESLDGIRFNLTQTLVQMGLQWPDSTIVVLGYPRLLQPLVLSNIPPFALACPGMTGISGGEALFFDDQAGRLNSAVADAIQLADDAVEASVLFIDVDPFFAAGGACLWDPFDWTRTINDVAYHSLGPPEPVPSANSLHPTRNGWTAYWQALASRHIVVYPETTQPLAPTDDED